VVLANISSCLFPSFPFFCESFSTPTALPPAPLAIIAPPFAKSLLCLFFFGNGTGGFLFTSWLVLRFSPPLVTSDFFAWPFACPYEVPPLDVFPPGHFPVFFSIFPHQTNPFPFSSSQPIRSGGHFGSPSPNPLFDFYVRYFFVCLRLSYFHSFGR